MDRRTKTLKKKYLSKVRSFANSQESKPRFHEIWFGKGKRKGDYEPHIPTIAIFGGIPTREHRVDFHAGRKGDTSRFLGV